MKTFNLPTAIPGEGTLEFKPLCPDNMKLYILDLRHHHSYPYERLLKEFPEYLKHKPSK